MSTARCVTVLLALVASILAVPPAHSEERPAPSVRSVSGPHLRAPAPSARELAGRNAVLTEADRATSSTIVPRPEAWHRLVATTVELDFGKDKVYVTGRPAGAPPLGVRPDLVVQVGTVVGTSCNAIGTDSVVAGMSTGEAVAYEDLPAGWENGNCVIALLFPDDSNSPSDALVGALTDEVVAPVLRLAKPTILGSQKLTLVRSVWTPVSVEVSNTGTGEARAVTVSGKGNGVKVKTGRLSYGLAPQDADGDATSGTVHIRIKLTAKVRQARLKLSARSDGETGTRTVKVRAVKAPPRPRPGRYESKDGDVRFTVRGGKVTGFRTRTRTRCGGYPGYFTYSTNTYNFPTTRISRAGIVHDRDRHDLYTVNLEMLVSGAKVTRGRFSYSGPNRCFAVETFDAKRVSGKR